MAHRHTTSDASTLTILSEELFLNKLNYVSTDEQYQNEDVLSRKAESYLRSIDENQKVEGVKVSTKKLLHAVMEHAPCPSGKRYAAFCIIACGHPDSDDLNRSDRLARLANDWWKFLLLPCTPCGPSHPHY
jgi:hypothetical protein